MERCPVEIWHDIFSHACVDGGRTACSLALASRRLRAISFPARYHSVTLRSHRALQIFDELADRLDISLQPVIHLYCLFFGVPESRSSPQSLAVLSDSAQRLPRLISRIAPTLLILSVGFHRHLLPFGRAADGLRTVLHDQLLHTPLPRLTILDIKLIDLGTSGDPTREVTHTHLPNLSRLCISLPDSSPSWLALWALLERFPTLTHLHLNNVACNLDVPCYLLVHFGLELPEEFTFPETFNAESALRIVASLNRLSNISIRLKAMSSWLRTTGPWSSWGGPFLRNAERVNNLLEYISSRTLKDPTVHGTLVVLPSASDTIPEETRMRNEWFEFVERDVLYRTR